MAIRIGSRVLGLLLVAAGCELFAPLEPLPETSSQEHSGSSAGQSTVGQSEKGGDNGASSDNRGGSASANGSQRGTGGDEGSGGESTAGRASGGTSGGVASRGGASGSGGGASSTAGDGDSSAGTSQGGSGGLSDGGGGGSSAGAPAGNAGEGGFNGQAGGEQGGAAAAIRDDATRADPGATQPTFGAWQGLGLASGRVPSAVLLSRDSFRLFVRDADDYIACADYARVPDTITTPQWSIFLPGGLFSTEVTALLRPLDLVVVALGKYDHVVYRSHWNDGTWYGWWPVGPQFEDVPVGLITHSGDVLYAGRDSDEEVRLATFSADGWWPEQWPSTGVETTFQPAVVLGAEGVHVTVVDKNGTLVHALRPRDADSGWNDWSWSSLPGVQFKSAPRLIARTPTRLDVFARGSDDCIYWQTREEGTWLGWVKVSGPSASNVLPVADGPSSFFLFMKDARSVVWGRRFSSDGWTSWAALGELASATDTEFPGSALAFGEKDVRLFALGPSRDTRMLTITP